MSLRSCCAIVTAPCLVLAWLQGLSVIRPPLIAAGAAQDVVWSESFEEGRLDRARWNPTAAGEVRDRSATVVEGATGPRRFRLALTADTRGAADDTVTVTGIRSGRRIPLSGETRVSLDLDWNDQPNGSYLSGGVVLSPHATDGDATDTPDWLKVEYVGVPPGRNARMVVAVRRGGVERTLDTEGWPDRNRSGRAIGLQHLTIVTRDGSVEVWENGVQRYASSVRVIAFDLAHLYLQMASHSNFPRRTIFFSGIRVERRSGGR